MLSHSEFHCLSYLVSSKPNIPISYLDFDSHPPFHDQISPRVEEDGVSGYVNPVI